MNKFYFLYYSVHNPELEDEVMSLPRSSGSWELAYKPNEISHMIFFGDHGKRRQKRSSLYPYALQHQ